MKKLILMLILIIFIAGCTETPRDPYQKEFAGLKINFRANLDEAEKIPVYPNETILRTILLNNKVEEIDVVYIPNVTENSFYLASSFELAYKLTVINKYYFNITKPINSIPVNSSLEAMLMSSESKPVIMLTSPYYVNETMVNVVGHFITAQGKSFEETDRKYNDLDLAVDKLLLVLMKEVNI
jgi:hypothetical protein